MSEIIVSLTTIPGRTEYLAEFLRGINRQTVQPSKIELNIPSEYQRRDLGVLDRRSIPSDFVVCDCVDYGPATKIIPTVARYNNCDVKIVYCDDDRVYNQSWLKRLIDKSNEFPDHAICEECLSIEMIERRYWRHRKDMKYKIKRFITLGLYQARAVWQSDVAQGFGGVLVRPEFFDSKVFSPPPVIWSVDDIWLSGNLAVNGVSLKYTERDEQERSVGIFSPDGDIGEREDALKNFSTEGYSRDMANLYAVKYFRKHYGIWQSTGKFSISWDGDWSMWEERNRV
jgi:hypothetical protein